MSEEMWDDLPKKNEMAGCIFGTLLGLAIGGSILFVAYSAWEAFWALDGVGKFWFLQAMLFVLAFAVYQTYKHDQESDNRG